MIRDSILVGFFLLAPAIHCFAPLSNVSPSKTTTALQASRRDALASVAALSVAAATPLASLAAQNQNPQQQWENRQNEPTSQFPSSGKLDLNNAFVGDFKKLNNMPKTTAAKIASNGPYSVVSDIYKIPDLSNDDVQAMKKNEKLFTLNKPGRQFNERMNERQNERTKLFSSSGKLDLNNAFEGDFRKLNKMPKTTAAKIASNGPYSEVSDIYQIPDLSNDDVKAMKNSEKLFTVNPPGGRQFKERMNQRTSST